MKREAGKSGVHKEAAEITEEKPHHADSAANGNPTTAGCARNLDICTFRAGSSLGASDGGGLGSTLKKPWGRVRGVSQRRGGMRRGRAAHPQMGAEKEQMEE